jgi:parallel beta-helix repeat protein
MFCERSSPRIVYCSFTENSAVGAGGLWCEESSPSIRYCSFSDNYGEDGGGVGLVYDSDANLSNCSFTDNVASGGGAGMICYDSSPIITDCLFQRNEVTWEDGGAILMIECVPVIANCVFSGNVADYAGGISLRYSSGTIVNCTFYDNLMAFYCSHESAGTVIGCTFYRNRGWGGRSGGIVSAWSSSLSVENTIVAFTPNGTGIGCWYSHPISLNCCDIFGNSDGDWVGCIADQYGINGNFSACPSFCNAEMGDFHLCDESPCLPGNHPDGYECGLIGAWGEGCSCGPSQTEPTTWGAIKAMYK